jgi:dienelactone hydrolase
VNESTTAAGTAAGLSRKGVSYRERVVRLGSSNELAGILCEPEAPPPAPRPVVVMWNVGLNHHVGPYRTFVDLSRELAEAGTSSIRFDLSGLGDSEFAANDARVDAERSVADVRAVLSRLSELTGSARAVLVGFCSSVDSAHTAALEDPKVVGLVNIEGYSFPTLGFRLRYPLRLLEVNRWMRWVHHRQQKRLKAGAAPDAGEAEQSVYQREYPTPDRLAREYRSLVQRGVRILCLYVRGDSTYEYEEQLFDFLGDRSLASHMEVEYFPDADHIFSLTKDRRRAVSRIVDFVVRRFV